MLRFSRKKEEGEWERHSTDPEKGKTLTEKVLRSVESLRELTEPIIVEAYILFFQVEIRKVACYNRGEMH